MQAIKPRMARRDMEFHGVKLKQGDRVFALLASANADLARITDPERLDIRREGVRHAGYGGGLHLCLGAHLTRVEVEAGLARVLARRSSFSLDVPVQNVRWLARPGMRGPVALPLRIAGARRQPHAA